MVDRFLAWRLPKPWTPDNGISYVRPNYMHPPANHDWPTGTNLFDWSQAEAMVRYMTTGLPAENTRPQPAPSAGEPDFDIMNGELEQEFYRTGGDRTHGYIRRYLVTRAYRLGLAARPKVEDADQTKLKEIALVSIGTNTGLPYDGAVKVWQALLNDLADKSNWILVPRSAMDELRKFWGRYDVLKHELGITDGKVVHAVRALKSALAEREADLAQLRPLIAVAYDALPYPERLAELDGGAPCRTYEGGLLLLRDTLEHHAARQQQKASAEPTEREGE